MNKVVEFLKANPVQYLATVGRDGKAKCRPFMFAGEMDGKLWFCTNNQKDVYKDMQANPQVELSVSSPAYAWIRLHGKAVFENHIVGDEDIARYFLTMWEEGRTKEKGYEFAIKSDLYGIMSLMVRRHIQSTMSNKQFLYKKRNLDSINRVIHYIEENYQKDISLSELAELLNVNRFYFCRFFKEVTGATPIEYLNNFRTHQAVSMMREKPEYTITQVATQVGYNDSNYFARVFKSVMGESPSVYKTRLEKEAAANG